MRKKDECQRQKDSLLDFADFHRFSHALKRCHRHVFNGFSNSIHSTKKSPCESRRIFLWQNYCKLIQCTASSGNAPSGHGPHFAGELNYSPFLFQLSVFRCLSDSVIGMLLAKPGIFPFPDDLRHTFATLPCRTVSMSKPCPACWVTAAPDSPSPPTPMPRTRCRNRRRQRWETC